MKKEFKLPKGVDVEHINIDVKTNLLTVIYKEETQTLEVNKWHAFHYFPEKISYHLYLGDYTGVGFDANGEWLPFVAMNDASIYINADMEEVKRLLIKEAEKRGLIGGALCLCSEGIFKNILKDGYNITGPFFMDSNRTVLFDFSNGKWAEIIEEKKPPYTNQYGTKFFGGENYYYLRDSDIPIEDICFNQSAVKGVGIRFIGTKKECYQYLADNCKE